MNFLYESEVWVDATGREHRIATMDIEHARNVMRYLERNVQKLLSRRFWESILCGVPMGEQAQWDMERAEAQEEDLISQGPLVWLHSMPLWEALEARVNPPKPPKPSGLKSTALPWIEHLPKKAVKTLLKEIVHDLHGEGTLQDRLGALDILLASWQHTAEVYADPVIYAALTRPINPERRNK